jgi:hypothetical protein
MNLRFVREMVGTDPPTLKIEADEPSWNRKPSSEISVR